MELKVSKKLTVMKVLAVLENIKEWFGDYCALVQQTKRIWTTLMNIWKEIGHDETWKYTICHNFLVCSLLCNTPLCQLSISFCRIYAPEGLKPCRDVLLQQMVAYELGPMQEKMFLTDGAIESVCSNPAKPKWRQELNKKTFTSPEHSLRMIATS